MGEVCFKVLVIIMDRVDTLYLHAYFAIALIEIIYHLNFFICDAVSIAIYDVTESPAGDSFDYLLHITYGMLWKGTRFHNAHRAE